jgi:glycosyltransferase involved in cell wall biosynthesis
VNHYYYIDTTSFKARIERRIRKFFHSKKEYYNYFIEFYFEKAFSDLKEKRFDYIILENCPGHAYKLSQRGYRNLILHLNNDLLNSESRYHDIIFNSLSLILTCSDYIKERVSTIQACNKIRTLYNAIDIKIFLPPKSFHVSRKQLGFSKDDFVIVYSGRINQDKGVSELIDAMLRIKKTSNIKLMIIGGSFFGNTNNEDFFIRSLKEKSKTLEERIVFTGFIPYEDVPYYLHLADIAVLPSMWDEPFGLTIAEALAAGLPLITTRSGGIPEICEGVAIIVDREQIVDNLANAILDLYHHPEKRTLMAKASVERAQQFDKETYAKNFFAALENL